MPAPYRYPGVYVEEIATLPPSVAEVATAVPAFVGYTAVGPADKAEPVVARIATLLEYETAFGAKPDVSSARLRGQEYLLERRLFRRRSTGEVIERDRKGGASWMRFAFPTWWHYDVLRGLDYLRRAGVSPDERAAEAVRLVASKRDDEGRWPLERLYPGTMPIETDEGEGRPSRWNTLRALRVLRYFFMFSL